ncbi:MAG: 16S rRNA (guanine(966)-N(2))-methyltransferase RsmD [Bdellovibrionales bacterium]
MRICGGQFRGRKLNTPTSNDIRPTSDKVRQALFNMLESRGLIQESIVLDGFCGTGALGLEALSRGAEFTIFIDKDRRSIDVCNKNIKMLEVEDQTKSICFDTSKAKPKPENLPQADLIFLDPPYHKDLITQAIDALEQGNWIKQSAVFILESEKQFNFTKTGFSLVQEKDYKDTKIMIVQKR